MCRRRRRLSEHEYERSIRASLAAWRSFTRSFLRHWSFACHAEASAKAGCFVIFFYLCPPSSVLRSPFSVLGSLSSVQLPPITSHRATGGHRANISGADHPFCSAAFCSPRLRRRGFALPCLALPHLTPFLLPASLFAFQTGPP